VEAWLNQDFKKIEALHNEVSRKEYEADKIKKQIRDSLPHSYFLPISRRDFLLYLNRQDAIADAVEDFVVLLCLRNTILPQQLHEKFKEYVEKVIETVEEFFKAAEQIRTLMKVSFSGVEAEKMLKLTEKINQLEWETDKIARRLAKKLFEIEEKIDPMTIYFCMQIFIVLGNISDQAENCADTIRMMIAKG
jgi:hypothetical protein